MDPNKKRKIDDNGADSDAIMLSIEDARRILEPFTRDQLLEIVQNALLHHHDVFDAVRSLADRDITQRKLFIRGLGWETTTEKLRAIFSSYGELEEAVVILDKVTGKSKGYGFITFKHIDGAIRALKEPSKKIDGRMTVTQLAATGISGGGEAVVGGGSGVVNNPVDVSKRKIYVANVPYDMPAERLLQHFSMYGEIEEGPLGFDKATGKSKGFALFVYKTAEAAGASLVDPIAKIDGHQLNCKLAIDGKRGKPPGVGGAAPLAVQGGNMGNGDGVGVGSNVPGGLYGVPGGHYGGLSGGLGTGIGGPGLSSQASGPNHGVSSGYGSGIVGPIGTGYGGGSHIGGTIGTGYGGLGSASGGYSGNGGALVGVGSCVGSGAGLGNGMGGAGRGSSLYGLPPSSTGMVGDYPQSAHYSFSGNYQGQHNQQAGSALAPRIPPGGGHQGMPHYY